jgi:hypothetical protein
MRTALVVAAISAFSADALAQDFRIGGELGLYHNEIGDASITFLTEVIDLDVTLFDTVAIVAAVPFVQLFAAGEGENEERFRIGNPQVSAYYQLSLELLRLRIGGGIGIPAAQVPDDLEAFTAILTYAGAAQMHGTLNIWHWTPETVPVMVPSLRIDVDLAIVSIDAGADIIVFVPIDDAAGDEVEVGVPLFAGAMVHLAMIGIGARLGAVFFPTMEEGDDKAQVSLSPRITATFEPIELEARATLNLDKPGATFDDEGVWGFFFGVHAVF